MSEWQKRGYEAWVSLWVEFGCAPNATQCPARHMAPDSRVRIDFISGWNKAKREHESAPAKPLT